MKMCSKAAIAIALAILALSSVANSADWFVDTQLGATYLKLPHRNLPGEESDEGTGMSVGGRVGWLLQNSIGMADKTSVELSGFYVGVEDARITAPEGFFFAYDYYGSIISSGGDEIIGSFGSRAADFGSYDLIFRQSYRTSGFDLFSVYAGFSALHLHQDFASSVESVSGLLFDLRESLDADYFGAKVGFTRARQLGSRWTTVLDGAVGFYSSRSTYNGEYVPSGPLAHAAPDLDLKDSHFAVQSQLKIELVRFVGEHAYLSCFGELQHLNHAPVMSYINGPASTIPPTRINDDELLGATLGLKLTFFR